MINIDTFIEKIEGEFEEVDKGSLTSDTLFKELEEWSSMHALLIVALIDMEYEVTITGHDLKKVETLQELYDIVKTKV